MIAGFYFTHKILTPIKKTTETVRKISRGQLNQKVEITTDDEVAELGLEYGRLLRLTVRLGLMQPLVQRMPLLVWGGGQHMDQCSNLWVVR